MSTTKAALVTAARQATVTTRDVGEPGPGQVLVEVDGCGVCGSALPTWEGRPWFSYPLPPGAPGHEGWGRVLATGGDDAAPAAGDMVAFLGEDAFAEQVIVPAEHCIVLPEALHGRPFPGEALGCGFNIARRSGFAAGQTVAIVGIGFLGGLVTALATAAGARVIAVSRRPFSLVMAKQLGAQEVLSLSDDVDGRVGELTDGAMCNVVVEAVGSQEALDLAGRLTAVRGRLVIAGFHQDGQRTVDVQLWNWRGIDVVNAHERDDTVRLQGIRDAIEAVASGALDPTPLYTHAFPLERLADGLDAMVERPDGFLKALMIR